jgi:UDP-glucose 4-epimerase
LGSLEKLANCDSIIHLAGVLGTSELFDTAELAVEVNVKGSLRILEFCSAHDIGYVGITMPPVFQSVYTATKVCADRLATAWHLSKGLRTSRVRAFNAYGAGQKHGAGHPQKILPTFATEAWAGRPIPIWGDGKQGVDLVHVDDLGRMLIDACFFGNDEVFDGGTGVALTVNDVAAHVLAVTGSRAGVVNLHMRAGEVPTKIVAAGEGWSQLRWSPQHNWDRVTECVYSYRPPS